MSLYEVAHLKLNVGNFPCELLKFFDSDLVFTCKKCAFKNMNIVSRRSTKIKYNLNDVSQTKYLHLKMSNVVY